MHEYAYRCEDCESRFTLKYARYADYDAAEKRCPHCGGLALTRLLGAVGGRLGGRDYAAMSAQEMLSVLETGEAREARRLYQAVEGGSGAALNHSATLPRPALSWPRARSGKSPRRR